MSKRNQKKYINWMLHFTNFIHSIRFFNYQDDDYDDDSLMGIHWHTLQLDKTFLDYSFPFGENFNFQKNYQNYCIFIFSLRFEYLI